MAVAVSFWVGSAAYAVIDDAIVLLLFIAGVLHVVLCQRLGWRAALR